MNGFQDCHDYQEWLGLPPEEEEDLEDELYEKSVQLDEGDFYEYGSYDEWRSSYG